MKALEAQTIPQAFFEAYKTSPQAAAYFTKSNGRWNELNFKDAFEYILKTLAGLEALKFSPGQRAIIFAENRQEWVLTDYAIQWMGGAVAAIYTTSSPEQIEYILTESEAEIVFISNQASFDRLKKVNRFTHLKYVVAWESVSGSLANQGPQIIQPQDFLKNSFSEAQAQEKLKQLKPDDVCILLYTSGTTGEPKGVILTHANIMKNLRMFDAVIPVQAGKTTMSFLPLSHIYERVVHSYLLFSGLKIYFAESVEKLIDNLSEVKPHVLTAVPRIFEKMYVRIMEKIKNAPTFRKHIFFKAQWIGQQTFEVRRRGLSLPLHWAVAFKLADAFVFKKIRAITGGRAELFISGGAPLSRDIAEFFFSAGFRILEGYGLSESCILSVNHPNKFKFGTVGFPFAGIEIKLAGDGEILARGPTIMKGYFKRPDATAEVIDSEGWFHTGDIGEFDFEGFLKITDRKKELIVLAAGKKVAPQPIENALKADPLIESICLIGDRRNFISALITPNLELCKTWATSKKGLKLETSQACAESPELKEHYKKTIQDLNANLPQYSTIKEFRVLPVSFTIETGELTPTLKLKRRVINEKFKSIIDSMYPEITA